MYVGIIGSRTFNNYEILKNKLDKLIFFKGTIDKIISGGANGADKLGEKYADENNIDKMIFYPEWDKYGKRAGFIRNNLIIENSDLILVFWDGNSKGTLDSINKALKLNKNIIVFDFNGVINRNISKMFTDVANS